MMHICSVPVRSIPQKTHVHRHRLAVQTEILVHHTLEHKVLVNATKSSTLDANPPSLDANVTFAPKNRRC